MIIKIKAALCGTVWFWMSQQSNYFNIVILFILISTVITTVLYMPCVLKANLLGEFFKLNCKILVRYDTNYFFPNSYIYKSTIANRKEKETIQMRNFNTIWKTEIGRLKEYK